MGFFSFIGRVLFASLFILSAWQIFNEFGEDGGPAAKELIPKFTVLGKHLSAKLGVVQWPEMDIRQAVATSMILKGIGGLLFVIGSSLGAYLLLANLVLYSPILYDFYNYSHDEPEFATLLHEFIQSVALIGALLFFVGMKYSNPKRQIKKKAPKAKTV